MIDHFSFFRSKDNVAVRRHYYFEGLNYSTIIKRWNFLEFPFVRFNSSSMILVSQRWFL